MNNYNEYRIFGGPFLPFVGGLVVGGLFSPNKGNNVFGNSNPNFTPSPYPVPINGPYTTVYPGPYIQAQPYIPTNNQLYYLQDPQINVLPTLGETRFYGPYHL